MHYTHVNIYAHHVLYMYICVFFSYLLWVTHTQEETFSFSHPEQVDSRDGMISFCESLKLCIISMYYLCLSCYVKNHSICYYYFFELQRPFWITDPLLWVLTQQGDWAASEISSTGAQISIPEAVKCLTGTLESLGLAYSTPVTMSAIIVFLRPHIHDFITPQATSLTYQTPSLGFEIAV